MGTHSMVGNFENIFDKAVESSTTKPFQVLYSNPPYQTLTTKPESTHQSVTNVFQLHQTVADKLSVVTNMIYPGERWIARTGRNLKQFSLEQLNSSSLQTIVFFPEVNKIFGKSLTINGGLSIVHKNYEKPNEGFWKLIRKDVESEIIAELALPEDRIISTIPEMNRILAKVFERRNNFAKLSEKVESRMVFGIESNFVDKNRSQAIQYSENLTKPSNNHVLVLTNDVAGPNGRVKWFWVPKVFLKRLDLAIKWNVVVSSMDAAATRSGSSHAAILPDGTAHGRARVILSSFDSRDEAENFYLWLSTPLIRALLSTTGNQLTSLGANVPLLSSYETGSKFFPTKPDNFSKLPTTSETFKKLVTDLNESLCDFFKLSESERKLVEIVEKGLAPLATSSSMFIEGVEYSV